MPVARISTERLPTAITVDLGDQLRDGLALGGKPRPLLPEGVRPGGDILMALEECDRRIGVGCRLEPQRLDELPLVGADAPHRE